MSYTHAIMLMESARLVQVAGFLASFIVVVNWALNAHLDILYLLAAR